MEFEEKVCRTCLDSGVPMASLNVKSEDEIQGRKMLEFLLGTNIEDSDAFSEICETCRTNLIFCYSFKLQCLESEEKIKQYTKVAEVVFPDPLSVSEEEAPMLIPKQEVEELDDDDYEEVFEDLPPKMEPQNNPFPLHQSLPVEVHMAAQEVPPRRSYRCGRCNIRFPDKQGYNKHFYREHLKVKANVPVTPPAPTRVRVVQVQQQQPQQEDAGRVGWRHCKKCNIKFPDRKTYNRHFYREHYSKKMGRRAQPPNWEMGWMPVEAVVAEPLNVTPPETLHMPPPEPQRMMSQLPPDEAKMKSYRCGRCDIRFPDKKAYNKHFYREHFSKEKARRDKQNQHKKGRRTTPKDCHRCKISFTDTQSWCEHFKTQHPEELIKEKELKGIPVIIPRTCHTCNITFPDGEALYVHNRDEHAAASSAASSWKSNRCLRCCISFPDRESFSKHKAEHHKRNTNPKPTTSICDQCGKTVSTGFLKEHLLIHQGKIFVCSVCNTSVSTKRALINHMNIHLNLKPYICKHCGETFRHWKTRRLHIWTVHETDKAHLYSCHICGKTFRHKISLSTHVKTHSDERPHQCEICLKGFRSMAYLRNHIDTHSVEKKYICKVCGKAFGTRNNLQQHKAVHDEVKKHACDICNRRFTQRHVLRSHWRAIHPEYPPLPVGTNQVEVFHQEQVEDVVVVEDAA